MDIFPDGPFFCRFQIRTNKKSDSMFRQFDVFYKDGERWCFHVARMKKYSVLLEIKYWRVSELLSLFELPGSVECCFTFVSNGEGVSFVYSNP